MTVRYVCGAVTAAVLTFGVPTIGQAQDLLPPNEQGPVTVAGCLQLGGKNGDQLVLAGWIRGPVASVPEATCSARIDVRSLDLDHAHKKGMDVSLLGRYIEVNGTLEREMHVTPHNLRELRVKTYRLLPVVPPREAAAAPIPPQIQPSPAAPEEVAQAEVTEEIAVGTSGTAPTPEPSLPKTASPVPAIGLLGLLAFAGGLVLRSRRSSYGRV